MPALTDRRLRGLKPKDTKYEAMCSANPGFGVWVYPSGSKTFIYRYRINTRLRRLPLGKFSKMNTLAKARKSYQIKKGLHENGLDPAQGALDTFSDVARAWLRDADLRPSTRATYSQILDRDLLPVMGDRKLAKILRRDVKSLLRSKKAVSPAGANKLLSIVRAIYIFALDEELTQINPALGIKMPARLKSRTRTLSDENIINLLNAPHAVAKDLLVCSLLTCARVGELARIEYNEVMTETVNGKQVEVWYLPAEKSKNKQPNLIPLPDIVVDIFKAQESPNEYIFGTPRGSGHIRVDSLSTWTARQGFKWSPHDCRRTCATRLARLREPRLVVDRLLNHIDNTATNAYDMHRYLGEMHEALNKFVAML